MSNFGSKFTEYGLTGGFFVTINALLVVVVAPRYADVLFLEIAWYLSERSRELPDSVKPVLASMLATITIVSVFALGLLLELVGSLFFAYESQIFQRYIRHNRWWLEKILSRYGRQMDTDYDRYCRQKLLLLQKLDPRHLLLYLTLWNKGSRSKVREEILAEVWMIRTHNRIHSYLIGYLGLMNEASRVQLLYDQMRTWRVSRSLVTGLFLSYILLGVLGAVRILDVAEVSNESAGTLSTISVINFLILAGSLLISILMIFVTLRSYSRYCETLFSLAHVTAVNQDPGLATAYAPSPPDALHRAGVQKGQD